MNQENGIKNIVIVISLLIVVSIFFSIFGAKKDTSEISVDSKTPTTEESTELQDTSEKNSEPLPTTPKPQPNPVITPPKIIPTPTPIEADLGYVVVTYTDSGFIPPIVQVRAGGSITFINSSSKPLWVTSTDYPEVEARAYGGFDQGKSVSSGETYTFSFTKVGIWGYKNLNLERHLGAVTVMPQ